MEAFKKGEKIGKYVINSFIKKGMVAESYSVLGPDDMMYFMKIYELQSIPREQLFEGKEVYEIQLCKELNTDENVNVVRYVDNGEVKKGNTVYHYLVTEFYRGMLLYEAVKQDGPFDLEDAVQIILCVLSGLSFIHSCALIHNDIRPSNIMLQELEDGMLMPTIIDLGHISYMVKGRPTFADEDLMPYFRAPETFRSVYTVKSDIFSTGALLYFLIFGKSPWEDMDLRTLNGDKKKIADAVKKARKQELVLETEEVKLPDYMKAILLKALAKKPEDRFGSAAEFAQDLMEKVMPELAKRMEENETNAQQTEEHDQVSTGPVITFKKGSGFSKFEKFYESGFGIGTQFGKYGSHFELEYTIFNVYDKFDFDEREDFKTGFHHRGRVGYVYQLFPFFGLSVGATLNLTSEGYLNKLLLKPLADYHDDVSYKNHKGRWWPGFYAGLTVGKF